MRRKFGIVVASGIAVAALWSYVRHSGEGELPPAPAAQSRQSADPVAEEPPAPKVPPVPRLVGAPAPEADATDPVATAKALTSSGARTFLDAAARARATATANELLRRAETASTRDGVEQRLLARKLLAAVYDCPVATNDERDAAYAGCRALFDVLVRGNGAPPEIALRHKVAAGESVWALAKGPWRQAGATVASGFVLWLNDVTDAKRLRVGQALKVPLEPLTIVVRKRAFELSVLLGGAPVERFQVAVGPDAKTPVGAFQAKDCLKNPDWYMNGKRIPFGAKGHIIGTRWIGLAGAPEADGIGIHGTTDESSIGTAASLGCIRMKNADVERLFEWVATGTRVEIRD
ncbi:MAG: L,D-transpeptidase [Planctomycetes bacterium]|nr:L,D-transpeptidase [Planctomycetota bacterium]